MDKKFFSCVSFFLTLVDEQDDTLIFRSSSTQPMSSVSARMEKHGFYSHKWDAVHNKFEHPNPISTLWRYEK
jgi:hypothetical protein